MTGRALVTGSSGLLGGCVIARLRERGVPVRLLDVVPPPPGLAAPEDDVRIADLRDAAAVHDACRDVEVVYHLAAGQRMKPQFRELSEDDIFAMNVDGVRHVLDAARAVGVRKVVHISSSAVYGIPRTVPVGEDHPQQPLGAYGRSKIEGERLCHHALDAGLDVTMLRPMSLFGPGMTGVFVLLFDWVRQGKNVYLLGSGRNRVQMASAWDVADACLLAADRPESRGAVLILGATRVATVREQVDALVRHAGSGSRIVGIPAGLLRTAARTLNVVGLSPIVPEHYLLADATFVLDVRRAQEILGWSPRFDNVTMTIDAFEWYCRNWATHAPAPSLVLRLLNALS